MRRLGIATGWCEGWCGLGGLGGCVAGIDHTSWGSLF